MTMTQQPVAEGPLVSEAEWAEHAAVLDELAELQKQVEACMRRRDTMWRTFMDRGLSRREVATHAGVTDRSVTLALERLERDGV